MFFITTQCIYLQLIQINFGQIGIGFIAVIFRILSTTFRSGTLDASLMEITYIDMRGLKTKLNIKKNCLIICMEGYVMWMAISKNAYRWINIQFETTWCNCFSYSFAVWRIAGRISASFIVINQTAYLIGWPTWILFTGTKTVVIHICTILYCL